MPVAPRRVILVSGGSKVYVEPHIALAQSLQRRGHHVKIASECCLKSYIESFGIVFQSLCSNDFGDFLGIESTFSSSNDIRRSPHAHQILESYRRNLIDVDVIVASGASIYPAYSIAQKKAIAFIPLFLQPVMPTSEFYSVFTQNFLDRLFFFRK